MRPGDLVEFETPQGHRLGAVLDTLAHDKLVLYTLEGDERRCSAGSATLLQDAAFTPGERNEAQAALHAANDLLGQLESRLAIDELWRVAGEADTATIPLLARTLLGRDGLPERIAVSRALRNDHLYFRRRKGRFEPRPREQVEEQLRIDEQSAGHDASKRDFLAEITRILDLPMWQRPAAFAEATTDPSFRRWADILRSFAADEEQYSRRTEATSLLAEIEGLAHTRFDGEGIPRGLRFMQLLGLWGPHELLAAHRLGVRLEHTPQMQERAAELAANGFDRSGREDLTNWWAVTIDDAQSRDFDDALSIQATIEGGWQLAIHIADPTAYISVGSELDNCIRRRGYSAYLPTGTAPMIPRVLSEDALSLVVGQDRPTVTFFATFDENLELSDWRIARTIIHVNQRLTYDQAAGFIEGDDSRAHAANVVRDLAYIADELHAMRAEHGATALFIPEPRLTVDLDEDPPEIELEVIHPSVARDMVSEYMVFAGKLAALFCLEHDVPIPFRSQPSPDRRRSDPLIQRVPAGLAREITLLKGMSRGQVSTYADPHAGLGLAAYAQTTSPIRRFADLVVLRQISAVLRGEAPPYTLQDIQSIIVDSESARNESRILQREASDYWMLHLLHSREGDTVDAVVVDRFDDELIEVVLPEFAFRTRMQLRGVQPGDTIRVQIRRARPRAEVLVLEAI